MFFPGLTAIFLLYTAVVVPPVIAFHWLDSACDEVPTLYFDCILDTFFILDIIKSFVTGIHAPGKTLSVCMVYSTATADT